MLACVVFRDITEAEVALHQHGDLYEISATATLPIPKDKEEISCKLNIPRANYTNRKTIVYTGTHNIINKTNI